LLRKSYGNRLVRVVFDVTRTWRLLATLAVLWWPLSAWAQSTAPPNSPPAPAAHSADDLSARATDPTASLMSFGFVNDFHTSFYDVDDKGFEFRFQPVVPFRAWGASNILRVVVPAQGSGPGNEGLKDVSIFDLVIVSQHWGRLAIGPVMTVSQSESDAESKFAIGPAIGVVRPVTKRLLVGAFSQNLFAAHVGISQLQPVITYQLGHGWALSAGDSQFTYDWERNEWTNLPLGFQIGVVRIVAKQPFRFYVNPQWNVKNITGAVESKVLFGISLLAPAA
jgi:hypothetical protein